MQHGQRRTTWLTGSSARRPSVTSPRFTAGLPDDCALPVVAFFDGKPRIVTGASAGRIDKAVEVVTELRGQHDTYVSPIAQSRRDLWCHMRTRRRGGKKHARALTALWADIDIAGPAHAETNLPADVAEVEAILDPLPPVSLAVLTGGGVQALWVLEVAHPIGPGNLDWTVALCHDWSELVVGVANVVGGWTIDRGLGDLARVLRVCGSANLKIEGRPRPVTLHPTLTAFPDDGIDVAGSSWRPSVLYSLDEIEDVLAPWRARRERAREIAQLRTVSPLGHTDGPNVLQVVDRAPWKEVWPAGWTHVDDEVIDGIHVERWRRPGDPASPYSAKCWPEGGCYVHSGAVQGLPAGSHSKATVAAWARGFATVSELARALIRRSA